MYTYYRGSTFQFLGQLQDDGVIQSLSTSTFRASVFDPTGNTKYGDLTVLVLDAPNGIVQLSYGDTSNWPIGRARIDMVLTLPNGNIVPSDPIPFRIEQTPMLP